MKKLIMIFAIFFSCHTKYNQVNYAKAILDIEYRTGELVTPVTLLNDKEFLNIFKHSDFYVRDAISFLSDTSHTEQQKLISIFSMQDLSVNNYIDYTKQCFRLHLQKRMSEYALEIVLYSDINNFNLNKVYKNPKYISIVKEVSTSSQVSIELKNYANSFLKDR